MPKSIARCPWGDASPNYAAYHDLEWGVPVHDDRVFFEFLILEGAQAGLSWSTILNKRGSYREAFSRFDPVRVARYDARRIEKLLTNPGIVRNRLKIASSVTNARIRRTAARMRKLRPLRLVVRRGKPIRNRWRSLREYRQYAESDALSRDLKRRGFRFVGSTSCTRSCRRRSRERPSHHVSAVEGVQQS
jgi:DNA-3-methyladenine glycosylase I